MSLDAFKDEDCDVLIQNVNSKCLPIFNKHKIEEKRAIYRYLFSRRPKKLPPSQKARLINLYDPMADRTHRFSDGLRWCINIYVGCEHNCGYCYVNGYSQDSIGFSPHPKKGFKKGLLKDFDELASLGVPAAPLHLSNSTDILQNKLEKEYRHSQFALEKILENRKQFTSVTILTKNPAILCDEPYLSIINNPEMKPFTVQVTCPYWNDEARLFFEPKAPSVQNRLKSIKSLIEKGVDVDLRIDPLFPSSRIDKKIRRHMSLPDYSMPEAQTDKDIIKLVKFAKESGVKAVIAKPLKVPVSKKAQQCKDWFSSIYTDAYISGKRSVKGGSWRLPEDYQSALISSVQDLCNKARIPFKHCMHDVLTRV